MQSNQQQAYDRGITIFSPDGRLYQVEYAREAVKRGSASIGVRTDGGVALLADRRIRSSLMEPSSVEKLHKADDHIGIASAGHVADARQLIDFARRQAQVNRLRYEEPIGVETLTKEVTDNIQQYTQVGGARPFGVALIIGGVEDGEPRLYETDPSGVPTEWKSVAIGNDREAILDYLEENYRPDADLDGAIDLALSALATAKDEALDAESVLLSTIDEERGYRRLSDDEIETALSDLDFDFEDEAEDES
ncbi:proteasome endopeptidase complex, archaeal, alpha subunit [Halobacteriales archaeon QH_6_64_20]|jgi:proteasome alpha subunit|nr:MAG: proteasome endopeptidase complex, archaeal, alpha subunit [Halobacteriales archaeon QH_6_64_20]